MQLRVTRRACLGHDSRPQSGRHLGSDSSRHQTALCGQSIRTAAATAVHVTQARRVSTTKTYPGPATLLAKGYASLLKKTQCSFPLTTNFSQNVTEPSKEISYPVGDLSRSLTKLTGPCAYILHSNPIPQQMVQMAFCDLSHTFHKQVTNVSQHVSVILLWGILTSPLREDIKIHH